MKPFTCTIGKSRLDCQRGLLCFFGCSILLASPQAPAETYPVSPKTDLQALSKKLVAGDTIVLSDGKWHDAEVKFERLPGTAQQPITIKAQTPGNVVMSGRCRFRLSGSYVTVSGLVFRNSDSSDVLETRSHSERLASHCRVTDCVFEQTADFEPEKESRWLSVYGKHNRIDHCYFVGKTSKGTTLVVWVADKMRHNRIDHNHFGPRPVLGKNGGETIRIGTSEVSELDSFTTVEDNYFFGCDGEAEVVSNKSCENTYRHNVFVSCAGALTLRHGHRCLVDANLFAGAKKKMTGGVRIIGESHVVTNNYFEGLRGDAERAAVCMMNGVPNSPLHQYAPVRNAIVANNTFVDCKVALELGVGAGKKQSAAPSDCKITHNLFLPDKWELSRVHSEMVNFDWSDNLLQSGRKPRNPPVRFLQVEIELSEEKVFPRRPTSGKHLAPQKPSGVDSDIDGESRTGLSMCGCDDVTTAKYKFVSPSTSGPSWMAPVEHNQ